ncbi:putative uncharacterized protein DDB_G0289963 [Microplitis mediator]|uniref:putative uncharacterized protein DDB_G0289963 n=1 Tax=Microplitis mediator TaxID=375433 RepID=UPI002556A849|nr:putative uncharacterized protein DDB_G0289963 [Microplitis mediator]
MTSVLNISMKILLFLFTIVVTEGSKCPQLRKPHDNSCSKFYDCINLPNGGYVWAPAKCTDGLVFQPHLLLCVLPGDNWTCNDSESINNQVSNNKIVIIDSNNKTGTNSRPNTAELINDPSPKLNTFNSLSNLQLIIPYPLNGVNAANRKEAFEILIPMKQSTNNSNNKNNTNNSKEYLNKIIFYQHIGPSIKQFISLPTRDYSGVNHNDLFNYLVEKYILSHKSSSSPIVNELNDNNNSIDMKFDEITGVNSSEMISLQSNLNININNIDEIDELTNVLLIKGNLGEKQYVTIDKYKSLACDLNIEILKVIPCMRGLRLPNTTDCMKYYTCNIELANAQVYDFTCPPYTAFNTQLSICDTQKYKMCKKNHKNNGRDKEEEVVVISNVADDYVGDEYNDAEDEDEDKGEGENEKVDKPCETTGKFSDRTSENSYYLCYSSEASGNIESIRMVCPNDLIFCQERKVCTAKRFCNN